MEKVLRVPALIDSLAYQTDTCSRLDLIRQSAACLLATNRKLFTATFNHGKPTNFRFFIDFKHNETKQDIIDWMQYKSYRTQAYKTYAVYSFAPQTFFMND